MDRVGLNRFVLTAVWLCLVGWAHAGGPPSGSTPPAAADFSAELRYLDADGDGAIDALELADGQQIASMLLALSWDACDRNQDGKLTPAEFRTAASDALQTLLSGGDDDTQQAEDALAQAVPMGLLLQQLGQDQAYADELAALRAAVEDFDDDESVVTHIVSNSARYPRLSPVIRTWVRHYPVKPRLRRHGWSHPHHHAKPAHKSRVHVGPKPSSKKGTGRASKPPRPAKPKGAKPAPRKGRGGGRRP